MEQFSTSLPVNGGSSYTGGGDGGTGGGGTGGGTPTPEPLTLDVQASFVEREGTVQLIPNGGTKPYRFSLKEEDLYYNETLGSINESTYVYTAGTSIGQVRIRVHDANERTADAVVAIIPLAPTTVSVGKVDFNTQKFKVTLSWSYENLNLIQNFVIECSTGGGPFVQIGTTNNTTYSDPTQLDKSTSYRYRIYAQASTSKNTYTSKVEYSSVVSWP